MMACEMNGNGDVRCSIAPYPRRNYKMIFNPDGTFCWEDKELEERRKNLEQENSVPAV